MVDAVEGVGDTMLREKRRAFLAGLVGLPQRALEGDLGAQTQLIDVFPCVLKLVLAEWDPASSWHMESTQNSVRPGKKASSGGRFALL